MQRDFADGIKLKNLRQETILEQTGGYLLPQASSQERGRRVRFRDGDVMMETESDEAMGQGRHAASRSQKKQRNSLLRASSHQIHFLTSELQNCKIIMFAVLSYTICSGLFQQQ